jgi:hypothetical protein
VAVALDTFDADARRAIGHAILQRVLRDHTYAQRAARAEAALLNVQRGRTIPVEEQVV